jgi:hypothetical protein
MNYEFIDSSIISKRIDRRTTCQKKWAAEKAARNRELKLEIYSVEELISSGFYNSSSKLPAYGIEVWTRNCTVRDEASGGEWEQRRIHTLSLSLPTKANLQFIEKMNPMYWEESSTYYWAFKQQPAIVMWCVFDLLSRILYLPHWDTIKSIPIRWRLGNENARTFAEKTISSINCSGNFDAPIPKIIWLGSLNATRHKSTSYDYDWQTGKMTRDEASSYWNKKILESK